MKDLDFLKLLKLDDKQEKELNELYTKRKEKQRDSPKFKSPIVANLVHQCDLLELPQDGHFDRCLVVTDVATRKTDAEPLTNKTSQAVLNAILKIYKRGTLEEPEYMITTDAGSEFLGEFKKYFKDKNVFVKVADAGRHRQVGLVESKNKKIGKLLFLAQTQQEISTGKVNKKWVKLLPIVIKFLNDQQGTKKKPKNDTKFNMSNESLDLLSVGQNVRVKLDRPINPATKKPITGEFRETDIRFSPQIYKVIDIVLQPNQPPLYQINNGKKQTLYTIFQLLKV
jgi:hypothetical protein